MVQAGSPAHHLSRPTRAQVCWLRPMGGEGLLAANGSPWRTGLLATWAVGRECHHGARGGVGTPEHT